MGGCQSKKRSLHDFTVKDIARNDVDLGIYKDPNVKNPESVRSVVLCLNSRFTETNYNELTEIYTRYRDKGFEILAFPCNQFGLQEPGTNEDKH